VKFEIEDLKSMNGLLVNGRVVKKAVLRFASLQLLLKKNVLLYHSRLLSNSSGDVIVFGGARERADGEIVSEPLSDLHYKFLLPEVPELLSQSLSTFL